jgi:hypothetical protein
MCRSNLLGLDPRLRKKKKNNLMGHGLIKVENHSSSVSLEGNGSNKGGNDSTLWRDRRCYIAPG